MSEGLEFRIEWLDAPSVSTPELANTWARYEIWVAGSCVTQVEAADGTFRRSVYGSLYPLAEWVASNWWVLNNHIRPSAVDSHHWTWPNVRAYPWLSDHNVRGAGDGMPWPDLTIVGEGAVTRLVWAQDSSRSLGPIRFASTGTALIRSSEVAEGLTALVDHVLERLAENGFRKTRLSEEWSALADTSQDELEFCQTVAQMGMDPYSLSDEMADRVLRISSTLPQELMKDFFDSVDAGSLTEAAEWIDRATIAAERASRKAEQDISVLRKAAAYARDDDSLPALERPWRIGYAMARRVREELQIDVSDRFDTSPWVGISEVKAASGGLQGVATVANDRCGLVLGGSYAGTQAKRFKRAQTIGRAISQPNSPSFLISSARSKDERVARAFAAELLAPADGIRQFLGNPTGDLDTAFERAAKRFDVSPLLVRHQYDNQLARAFG
ncbi:hypothetical protein [Actinoplanes sp. NBRC 103695]|uniref:ImmA/IrrE family metallo-endopeptidase n=1 Tax=Actinoplanes sp. NBRC 103695 TaxID=3032202 RepID=UPI0024A4CD75|nr:hypothetical protein [Actinoplanes sp. NBRC 103695]GLZ01398.1 hypothetical protein Acsp02_86490 [Actinoplanes sp. NBRC 103695]